MPGKLLRQFSRTSSFLMGPIAPENIFIIALAISVCLHSLTIAALLITQKHPSIKNFQKMEVVYQTRTVPAPEAPRLVQNVKSLQEKKAALTPQILTKKEIGPVALMKEFMKSPSQFKPYSKQPAKLNALDTKRHVSIPMLESDKIMNPRYLNYNERIREKIRNRAYFYIENPDFKVGEVYLTFILLADGNLKDVRIMDDKTQANDYLRNIGLRSIKESAPFPAFPTDLKYPELTFNVVISFEVASGK